MNLSLSIPGFWNDNPFLVTDRLQGGKAGLSLGSVIYLYYSSLISKEHKQVFLKLKLLLLERLLIRSAKT